MRRIHSAGATVRVEIQIENGQTLSAELSQDRFNSMGLEVGGAVFVRPRHIRVFAGSR